MQQVLNIWNALETRRKVIVVLATVAMLATVTALARLAATPSLALLYSGLENGAAGEVVRALEQRGVTYEVRGGAIFVESARRDALRMTLASEGMPANNARGYELLDGLSGFGTTSQMFDAAYWRAKEGELARTIVAGPGITSARVHIANTDGNPFRRDLRPSASVAVTASGGPLPPSQARALRYLVASAVAGLQPDDVTVIDGTGAIVAGAEGEAPSNTAEDRSIALRDKVQRLLEARVGQGNAVVEVTLETVTESESIRERTFDPNGRVAISTETEESSDSSRNAGGGEVTVASNLPDGEAGGGESSDSQNSRVRERVNYEVSGTEREIQRAAGAIRRLTVAVLVNGTAANSGDGTETIAPRPDDELAALRDLVASAVGFDEARGDVITLKSMIFEPVEPMGTAVVPGLFDRLALDTMSLIQMAVLALVALLLGLFVIRPVLVGGAAAQPASLPPPAPAHPTSSGDALTGEIADADGNFLPAARPTPATLAQGDGTAQADAVQRLRALIGERQDETVEILRTWLEEEEPAR
ncbi:flagellar M-ring protein FliF [Lutimaribacter pacificus]|uniref:Flagellar M-ring protein n=1 Tax=Lutimaribacter pacificus TaxID=391948 RepID=A0A1H0EEQ5_9RHOB|nr:flagellar basal-body MS-ring/collar protein FliF [Lutimaribacter pacificus]SDN80766.1 flagellar M-ring protein FliF [Lutimaribacter pacificus]SHK53827.1 flagellar M-ring protein FliF [Lutimaribacter pacificus]